MAAFVKKLDPNHLVSVGLIGWYGASTPDRCAPSTCLQIYCINQGLSLRSPPPASCQNHTLWAA